MMRYNPVAQYVPRKQLVVADTLSQHPQPTISSVFSELVQEVEAYENAVSGAWPISPTKLESVKSETEMDFELQKVRQYVTDGWPRYGANVPQALKSYYSARHHLSIFQDLVLYDDRIIIPQNMRSDILQRLHSGHQGIVKCRKRARCSVWWPGLSQEIQQLVNSCKDCLESRPTQRKEPLLTTPLPDRPWERIGADICEVNKQHYLVVVDYFSRYTDIAHLQNLSGETTRACLKNMFARWGCPNILFTDNGPQFSGSAFKDFARDYDFQHITSSPYYAQSNGEAERAVQTAKRILKQSDPFTSLMSYRATPLQATGVSPAQLMMGRQIRTTVPTLESHLPPEWHDLRRVRKAHQKAKRTYRKYYNKRNGIRTLPEIPPGTSVAVKLDAERGWIRSGTILRKCESPRSYLIQSETGVLR
uniref:Gypsy retrotransposon integrase-like protein 1 n=1 Tax=Cyprinus carpio carpio TaxID=630221 RepID=A0A9J8CHS5_CYPCA